MSEQAPEFLTVPELAALLRIKERKVYDLAASGTVPCTRATGKLLFPELEVRAWISNHQQGKRKKAPLVFLGSHDPLLEWALRQSGCGLATYFDGSQDGLERFGANEGLATGLHIFDEETGDWNIPSVGETCRHLDVVLLAWVKRQRGIVVSQHLKKEISNISDLSGRKIAARQKKSGADALLSGLLKRNGVEGWTTTETTHSEQEAVLSVAEGKANVAFGLEYYSKPLGLEFIPLVEEQFDILVDRAAYFDAPFQSFLKFCSGSTFLQKAQDMTGTDASDVGLVRWNS